MKKRNWKYLLWTALPLALAAGCAHNERSSSVAVNPFQNSSLPPTSDTAQQQVYSGDMAPTGQYAPPAGASAADWTLAEKIRGMLSADPKLTRAPVAAVVNNGVVTLRGYVHNERQRERVKAAVASVPGVTQVNDQLEVKNILGSVPGETKSY
jgi:hypothetical protein